MGRWVLAAMVASFVACDVPDGSGGGGGGDAGVDPGPPPTNLPQVGGNCVALDCFDPLPPVPSLGAWLGGAQVVVIGDVVAIEPLLEPAQVAVNNGPVRTEETCNGSIEGGVIVVLSELDALSGAVQGTDIRIKFSHRQVEEWCPAPYVTRSGIEWSGDRRIGVGQRLGLRLYMDPDWGELTPLGGLMFLVGSDGRIHFQEDTTDCVGPAPAGLEGATPDEARALFAGVDQGDADFRMAEAGVASYFDFQDPEARRIALYGAVCFEPVDDEVSGCTSDLDCPPATRCEARACVAA